MISFLKIVYFICLNLSAMGFILAVVSVKNRIEIYFNERYSENWKEIAKGNNDYTDSIIGWIKIILIIACPIVHLYAVKLFILDWEIFRDDVYYKTKSNINEKIQQKSFKKIDLRS